MKFYPFFTLEIIRFMLKIENVHILPSKSKKDENIIFRVHRTIWKFYAMIVIHCSSAYVSVHRLSSLHVNENVRMRKE